MYRYFGVGNSKNTSSVSFQTSFPYIPNDPVKATTLHSIVHNCAEFFPLRKRIYALSPAPNLSFHNLSWRKIRLDKTHHIHLD
mmetsp:Transcript_7067/g.14437  ORF Transcript_7067/g.14437 Transcript_7067/m.14437 type:complete len:83 (+) Transcript_7067:57-305(+)